MDEKELQTLETMIELGKDSLNLDQVLMGIQIRLQIEILRELRIQNANKRAV